MTITQELSAHPITGFILSVLFYCAGFLVTIFEAGFPLWVMQSFQLIAWTIAIIVGTITIIEWCKKTFKYGNKSKKN
jgi:hypothetical protein